jgi:hypothetical protein
MSTLCCTSAYFAGISGALPAWEAVASFRQQLAEQRIDELEVGDLSTELGGSEGGGEMHGVGQEEGPAYSGVK